MNHSMFAGVDWRPLDTKPDDSGLPYATHSGVLDIVGHKLRCFRLNDGRAIFDAEDVQAFFGALIDGEES